MLKWEFIKKTLVDIGLLNHMVNLIWSCFSTPYMNVLWNVKFWRNFPQREASDKAIPYHLTSLFYTLRGFLQLISIATDQGVWHPIRLSRNDPHITHLAFANDVILFAEASLDQVHSIKNILNLFCRSSSRRSIWISLRCSFPIMLVGK